jgi:hypothetical protein
MMALEPRKPVQEQQRRVLHPGLNLVITWKRSFAMKKIGIVVSQQMLRKMIVLCVEFLVRRISQYKIATILAMKCHPKIATAAISVATTNQKTNPCPNLAEPWTMQKKKMERAIKVPRILSPTPRPNPPIDKHLPSDNCHWTMTNQ